MAVGRSSLSFWAIPRDRVVKCSLNCIGLWIAAISAKVNFSVFMSLLLSVGNR